SSKLPIRVSSCVRRSSRNVVWVVIASSFDRRPLSSSAKAARRFMRSFIREEICWGVASMTAFLRSSRFAFRPSASFVNLVRSSSIRVAVVRASSNRPFRSARSLSADASFAPDSAHPFARLVEGLDDQRVPEDVEERVPVLFVEMAEVDREAEAFLCHEDRLAARFSDEHLVEREERRAADLALLQVIDALGR